VRDQTIDRIERKIPTVNAKEELVLGRGGALVLKALVIYNVFTLLVVFFWPPFRGADRG
jgi:hypothetical protein